MMSDTTPVSAFPWYDLPAVHWANEAIWRATGLPGRFVHNPDVKDLWRSPSLLVTQACGLDLFLAEAPIEPIAVPVFDLDCRDGDYFSYLVGDPAGRTAAGPPGDNGLPAAPPDEASLAAFNPFG